MKKLLIFGFVAWIFLFSPGLNAQTEKASGCQDHPVFPRVPNYFIKECTVRESDSFSFPVESRVGDSTRKKSVDGKYYYYSYSVKEDSAQTYPLLIFKTLESDLKKVRGRLIARVVDPELSHTFITGEVPHDNLDTWVLIQANGHDYQLNIIEKPRVVNVIPADEMWDVLAKKDSVTLDIFFDDDTTTIIPASFPVIDQVSQMLKSHPSAEVDIQCHTDNNPIRRDQKILAAERAKIVLDALTAKGIEKPRLTSRGWGPMKPVADNKTDEGRAKNRRVVIVLKKK